MSLPPDTLTVLAACRDALRSYQYANAAPDLARMMADEADRILGRPIADRPSLTPNEDAVRQLLQSVRYSENAAKPGLPGVGARMAGAIAEARTIAVAREFDRGTSVEDVVNVFIQATADEVAAVATGMTPNGFEGARAILAGINFKTGIALGRLARGETTMESAKASEAPQA